MNRKKFEKKIAFEIEKGVFTSWTIEELINNDKKSFFNNVNIYDLIEENFETIISKCHNKSQMIDVLYKYDKTKEMVNKDFLNIILHCDCYEINEINRNTNLDVDINEIINNNFEYFLEKYNIEELYKLYFNLKSLELSSENKDKLNTNIAQNKDKFAKILYKLPKFEDKKDSKSVLDITTKIIDELCEEEKITYTDIKKIGSGAYSNVYLIGDKVLKLGEKRRTYDIPDDKRILKPLIRVDLSKYSDVENTIEVSNKVDTNINLSDDELYNLYKELRERNIVFTDLRNANLGYLLEDNNYNWDKQLSDILEARGIISNNERNEEILKKGDIVITDTDFIFRSDDPNIDKGSGNYEKFEKRYQEEKKKNSFVNSLKSSVVKDEEFKLKRQEEFNEIDIEDIDISSSYYHFTSKENLEKIKKEGLKPQIGGASNIVDEKYERVYFSKGGKGVLEIKNSFINTFKDLSVCDIPDEYKKYFNISDFSSEEQINEKVLYDAMEKKFKDEVYFKLDIKEDEDFLIKDQYNEAFLEDFTKEALREMFEQNSQRDIKGKINHTIKPEKIEIIKTEKGSTAFDVVRTLYDKLLNIAKENDMEEIIKDNLSDLNNFFEYVKQKEVENISI